MRFFILFLFLPLSGMAQTQFWNTSCETAKFLCENFSREEVPSLTQPDCSGGFDVFYYYRTEINQSGANIMSIASSIQSGYSVYGPFDNLSDGCGSLGTAIVSSSSNATSHEVTHTIQAQKLYILKIHFTGCTTSLDVLVKSGFTASFSNNWASLKCTDCIPAFRPQDGEYVVSAWVKDVEAVEVDTTTTYLEPEIVIVSGLNTYNLKASGEIIDGWQRIQAVIEVTDQEMDLTFRCYNGDCYFDDIRIFPNDGSMVTYVYDPLTFRLMAELDDNNYAKFYEYDEDGKLIRVKKETERGIMTIQESRENNSNK